MLVLLEPDKNDEDEGPEDDELDDDTDDRCDLREPMARLGGAGGP